jgi:hypothetical protein
MAKAWSSEKKHKTANRLMWMDVKYEPGTVKVVALMTMVKLLLNKCTAGKPYQIVLDADRKQSLPMVRIYLCNRICS